MSNLLTKTGALLVERQAAGPRRTHLAANAPCRRNPLVDARGEDFVPECEDMEGLSPIGISNEGRLVYPSGTVKMRRDPRAGRR